MDIISLLPNKVLICGNGDYTSTHIPTASEKRQEEIIIFVLVGRAVEEIIFQMLNASADRDLCCAFMDLRCAIVDCCINGFGKGCNRHCCPFYDPYVHLQRKSVALTAIICT